MDHQVNISLNLAKANILYHFRKMANLTPPWCFFNPNNFKDSRTWKSILLYCISLNLEVQRERRSLDGWKIFIKHYMACDGLDWTCAYESWTTLTLIIPKVLLILKINYKNIFAYLFYEIFMNCCYKVKKTNSYGWVII